MVNNAFASLEEGPANGGNMTSGEGMADAGKASGASAEAGNSDGFGSGMGGSSVLGSDSELESFLRSVPQKVEAVSVSSFDEAQKIIAEAKEYAKGNDDRFIGYSVVEDSKDEDDFIGLGISFESGKAYFLRQTEKFTAKEAGKVLEELSKECRLATFDIKNTYHLFTPYEIDQKKE